MAARLIQSCKTSSDLANFLAGFPDHDAVDLSTASGWPENIESLEQTVLGLGGRLLVRPTRLLLTRRADEPVCPGVWLGPFHHATDPELIDLHSQVAALRSSLQERDEALNRLTSFIVTTPL